MVFAAIIGIDCPVDGDSTCWGNNLAGQGGEGPYVHKAGLGLRGARPSGIAHLPRSFLPVDVIADG